MQTKILVTGGLGFIGTNLIHELENRGHEVWACDIKYAEMENFVRCDADRFPAITLYAITRITKNKRPCLR